LTNSRNAQQRTSIILVYQPVLQENLDKLTTEWKTILNDVNAAKAMKMAVVHE